MAEEAKSEPPPRQPAPVTADELAAWCGKAARVASGEEARPESIEATQQRVVATADVGRNGEKRDAARGGALENETRAVEACATPSEGKTGQPAAILDQAAKNRNQAPASSRAVGSCAPARVAGGQRAARTAAKSIDEAWQSLPGRKVWRGVCVYLSHVFFLCVFL